MASNVQHTNSDNLPANGQAEGAKARYSSLANRAECLVRAGRTAEARTLIAEELAVSGQSKELLLLLARIEFEGEHIEAAVRHASNAAKIDYKDASVAAGCANLLAAIGNFRKAQEILTSVDTTIRDDWRIRTALGDLLWEQGWYALAAEAYGEPRDLPQHARRRKTKWCAGGPIPLLHNRIRNTNERQERAWRIWTDRPTLAEILRPLGLRGELVQAEVDSLNLRWIRIAFFGWWGDPAGRWARRVAAFVMSAIVWVGLLGLFRVVQPGDQGRGTGTLWALLGIIVAYASWKLIERFAERAMSHRGVRIRWIASTAVFTIGGALVALAGVVTATGKNQGVAPVGVGLVAAPLLAAVAYGAPLVIRSWALGELDELRAQMPRAAFVDALGDLIEEISDPENRNSISMRARWVGIVESAARVLDKYLPDYLVPPTTARRDPETRERVCAWATRTATALRRLKQDIVAPQQSTWDSMLLELQRQVAVAASGDFGSLEGANRIEPATSEPSKPTRRGLVILRAGFVAILPIVTAFILIIVQPTLQLDGNIVRWATGIGVAWFVYSVLFYLDPALRQKAEIVRGLPNGLVPSIGKPGQDKGEAGPGGTITSL